MAAKKKAVAGRPVAGHRPLAPPLGVKHTGMHKVGEVVEKAIKAGGHPVLEHLEKRSFEKRAKSASKRKK